MGPTKSDAKKTAPKLVDYGTFKLGLHNMIMSGERRRRLTHCSGNLMTTHAEERQPHRGENYESVEGFGAVLR